MFSVERILGQLLAILFLEEDNFEKVFKELFEKLQLMTQEKKWGPV